MEEKTIWESPVKGKGVSSNLSIIKKGFVRIILEYFDKKYGYLGLADGEIECEDVEICYPDKSESVIHFWTNIPESITTLMGHLTSSIEINFVEKIYMLGNTLVIECSDKEISKEELKQTGMI
jgi:hypothetical protein